MFRKLSTVFIVVFSVPIVAILILALTPSAWLGQFAASLVNKFTSQDIAIERAQLDVMTRSPQIELNGVVVRGEDGNTLADVNHTKFGFNWTALWGDDPILRDARVEAATFDVANGGNRVAGQNERNAYVRHPFSLPQIGKLDLSVKKLFYRDNASGRQAELQVAVKGSTIDEPLRITATGNTEMLPLRITAVLHPEISQTDIPFRATAFLGDTQVTVEGTSEKVLGELELLASIKAPSLDDVAVLMDIPLPTVPPFSVGGTLLRDNNDIVFRRFDGALGDSSLEGDVRVDLTDAIPRVYANLIFTVLDLDDLAGLIGGAPDPTETASAEQRLDAKRLAADDKVLPQRKIELIKLARIVSGAIDFSAKEVRWNALPVRGIDVRVEIERNLVRFSPLRVELGDGSIGGELIANLNADTIEGQVELDLNGVNLQSLMASRGMAGDGFGIIGGKAKFWARGNDISEMARSLDGGFYLVMTNGKLDSLLTELAGLDLAESAILLTTAKQEATDIRCAYADIHARSGTMNLNTVVLDTDDTVFLAEGRIEFSDESLDLTIEPHPKDISFLTGQTSVKVTGSFNDPVIAPGEGLTVRATAAALLAGLAAPVAAIVPLISPGSGQDSHYCQGLSSELSSPRK